MTALILFTFAFQANIGIAASTKRRWSRRLNSCRPPPDMLYVIGLDASESMKDTGWEAATRFANAMIDYILEGPGEVMIYYFNGLLLCWLCAGVVSSCLHWMTTVLFTPPFTITQLTRM